MARACERHINSRFDHARRQLFGAVVAGAIMLVLLGTPAQAWVEIDVTTTDDVLDAGDGVVSLREAVIEANALAGDDTISVPAGTYTLSIAGTGENAAATGDLDITDNLTITGAGACQTIIDANGIDRVFHVFGGVSADISGVTITGGSVNGTEDGAGILNLGTLTVTDSTITANAAAGHNSGGGGIDNEVDATLMVTGSTISNNVANDGGGGIGNNGDLTVINSTISGNTNPNDGVGDPGSDAGGGIGNFEFGTATIINSTISNNSAAFAGGGLINENVAVEVNVGNTIIAGNTTVGSGPDVGGAFTSGGNNLIGDGTGSTGFTDGVNSDQVGTGGSPINPLLGPLQDNGGSTSTHALLTGSPAIDAGSPTCPPPFTDQRGIPRPQGLACDIGAYEFQGTTSAADITGPDGVPNGCVDAFDLGAMLGAWCSAVNDPNPPSPPCENCTPANLDVADISGEFNVPDGCVDAFDLAKLLASWCSVAGGNPCGTCFGPPLMPFPISVEPPPADQLAVGGAFDGTNFLVGIQGDNLYGRGGSSQITAQLVSQTGTLVGPLIEVERTGGGPSVAFDGTNYLLVWIDDANFPDEELYGQFISPSGALIGTPFLIAATVHGTSPANLIGIAFAETGFLVTYYREINQKTVDSKLYGRIVGTDASVGEELSISTGFADHAAFNIAWDETNYLVIWVDDDNDAVVMGRFVSPTGSLGLEFTINATPDISDNAATVAFDGANYLVAWSDEVGGMGSGQWDVLGQLVSTAGNLVGGMIPISTTAGMQFFPFIAFDGANYLVTWTDFRNDANGDFVCDACEGTCANIYGQYISTSGTLIGSEFTISTEPDNQLGSGVVFADGKYLVVYNTSPDFETGLGVFGVFITP